ncbi:hypothetical protein C8R43DRAFT_1128400 [Mycena crocata]|nr:hypothetical protein C8R43DRAFT_1128400 [Mycena crocata]
MPQEPRILRSTAQRQISALEKENRRLKADVMRLKTQLGGPKTSGKRVRFAPSARVRVPLFSDATPLPEAIEDEAHNPDTGSHLDLDLDYEMDAKETGHASGAQTPDFDAAAMGIANDQQDGDSDDGGMSGLWVLRTALADMRKKFDAQKAARKKAEKLVRTRLLCFWRLPAAERELENVELQKKLYAAQDELVLTRLEIGANLNTVVKVFEEKRSALQQSLDTMQLEIKQACPFESESHRRDVKQLTETNSHIKTLRKKLKAQKSAHRTEARDFTTKHEELQLTCRQLIVLVEGLEAAGGTVNNVNAFGRLYQKYTTAEKARHIFFPTILLIWITQKLAEANRRNAEFLEEPEFGHLPLFPTALDI